MMAIEVRRRTPTTWVAILNAVEVPMIGCFDASQMWNDFLGCSVFQHVWSIGRKFRNQLMHMLYGNGGKGYRKGNAKGKVFGGRSEEKSPEQLEQEFTQQVRDALPEQAKIRGQSSLVQEEWDVLVLPYQHLSASGGVSLVPKDALVDVLKRVGFTGKPTGILVVQNPDELGMRGYPRSMVTCSLSVAGADGQREIVTVKRWLVQLGFGEPARRVVEGEEVVMPTTMKRMTAKFSKLRGWDDGTFPASVMMAYIAKYVPDLAIDQVQARMNGSFSFLCHVDLVEELLRASGIDGVYFKCQADDVAGLELLWLPDDAGVEYALKLAKNKRVFGLAEKGGSGRLALRFKDNQSLASFATEHKLDDTSKLARWKLSGFPIQGGLQGLTRLLEARQWKDVVVLYMDDFQAVFHSSNRGDDLPMFYRKDDQGHQLRFKALNAVARGLQQSVRSGGQGDGPRRFPAPGDARSARQRAFLQGLASSDVRMSTPRRHTTQGHTGLTPPQKEPRKTE